MNMMTLFNELDHNGENRFSEADWTARWVHEAQQVGSFEAKQKLDRIRQLLEKCQYTRKKREVQLVFDMLDGMHAALSRLLVRECGCSFMRW